MIKSIYSPIYLIIIIIMIKIGLSVGLATIFHADSQRYGDRCKLPMNLPPPPSPVLPSPLLSVGGFLDLTNRLSNDVYIKLVEPRLRSLVKALYVKSNSTSTLEEIPAGTYEVQFFYGKGWDSKTQSFTRNKSLEKSDTPIKFNNAEALVITLN